MTYEELLELRNEVDRLHKYALRANTVDNIVSNQGISFTFNSAKENFKKIVHSTKRNGFITEREKKLLLLNL